jgi:hypothetical protein
VRSVKSAAWLTENKRKAENRKGVERKRKEGQGEADYRGENRKMTKITS